MSRETMRKNMFRGDSDEKLREILAEIEFEISLEEGRKKQVVHLLRRGMANALGYSSIDGMTREQLEETLLACDGDDLVERFGDREEARDGGRDY